MKKIIVITTAVLLGYTTYSQKSYVIKAGQHINEVLSFADIYRYPKFILGTVIFVDGRNSSALLNYNKLSGEIDFVTPQGDTLALADVNSIKIIQIEKDSFQYSDGFIRILAKDGPFVLGVKEEMRIQNMAKLGAYDQPVNAGVELYGGLNHHKSVKLVIREDVTLSQKIFYYIGSGKNFLVLNKKNIIKTYPKYETEILNFFRANHSEFATEADALKLFNFLKSLKKKS